MQNKLDAGTARLEEAERRISEIEDKIMENDEAEKKREKILDHEGTIRELSYSMKCNNIHIIGVPEEEREKGEEVYLHKLQLRTSPVWGRKQASKSRRHRELPSEVTGIGLFHDIS